MIKIIGYICPKCKDFIFSTSDNFGVACTCKCLAVSGVRKYKNIVESDMIATNGMIQPVSAYLEVDKIPSENCIKQSHKLYEKIKFVV